MLWRWVCFPFLLIFLGKEHAQVSVRPYHFVVGLGVSFAAQVSSRFLETAWSFENKEEVEEGGYFYM